MRRALGVRRPFKVSNKALYEKSHSPWVGVRIIPFRWSLFIFQDASTDGYVIRWNTRKVGVAFWSLIRLFCPMKTIFKQYMKPSTYKQTDRSALSELRKLAMDRVGRAGLTNELFFVLFHSVKHSRVLLLFLFINNYEVFFSLIE